MILRRFASSFSASSPRDFKLPPTIRRIVAESRLEKPKDVVTVSGWIKSIRRQKHVSFAIVTDGSSAEGLQAVLVGGGERVKALTNGAAVRLTGKLVASPGSGQDTELLVDFGKAGEPAQGRVEVLGACDPETYPIQKKALSTEYLRDHVHLRARTDSVAAMIRLRDQLKRNIGSFFQDQGFCYAHTPVLTTNDAEAAGETFKIAEIQNQHHPAALDSPTRLTTNNNDNNNTAEFFGHPAYLTVSHQLHLEALATALSRVYTLSPCFRAEPSQTGRHLAEFSMLEAEWAFGQSGDIEEVCSVIEACLRHVGNGVIGDGRHTVDVLWAGRDQGGGEARWKALVDAVSGEQPWKRMSYTDAVRVLEEHYASSRSEKRFVYEPRWGRTLQSEHERWLAEEYVRGPVFITDYPRALKPFYMRVNEGGQTVACVDLIMPYVGELAGGSVREERVGMLEEGLEMGVGGEGGGEAYRWYLDLRRFGGAPHAGFGIGFERLVGWIGGIENVRECVPFPRWAGRMLL